MRRPTSVFLCGSLLVITPTMPGCGVASAPNSSKPALASSSTSATAASSSSPKVEAIYYLDEQAGCFLTSPVFSPDGKLVAVGQGVKGLSIRNARDGAVLHQFEVPGDVQTIRFQDDAQRLLVITDIGAIAWDTTTGAPVFSRALHALGGRRHALFSPSGQWFVTTDHLGAIQVIDVASTRVTMTMTAPAGSQIERFSTKSDRLMTSSGQAMAGLKYSLWEIPSGKKLAEHRDANLSPDLQWAIITDADAGSVHLVDAATGAQRWKQVWPGSGTTEVTWSPDGTRVAFVSAAPGSKDNSLAGQLSVLDVATQKLTVFEFRVARLRAPDWGRGGRVLFVGKPASNAMDTPERVALDASTGKPLRQPAAPGVDPDQAADVAGTIVARGAAKIQVQDGNTGVTLWSVDGPQMVPFSRVQRSVAISTVVPGVVFAANADQKALRVLRFDSGETWSISDEPALPRAVLFEGSTLVGLGIGDQYGGVRVWSLGKNGTSVKTIHIGDEWPHDKELLTTERQAALSRDGKYLALGHAKAAEIWDTALGKRLVEVPGQYVPRELRFSPKGDVLAIDSSTLRVIRVPSGEELMSTRDNVWWRFREDGALLFIERDPEAFLAERERTAVVDSATGKRQEHI